MYCYVVPSEFSMGAQSRQLMVTARAGLETWVQKKFKRLGGARGAVYLMGVHGVDMWLYDRLL